MLDAPPSSNKLSSARRSPSFGRQSFTNRSPEGASCGGRSVSQHDVTPINEICAKQYRPTISQSRSQYVRFIRWNTESSVWNGPDRTVPYRTPSFRWSRDTADWCVAAPLHVVSDWWRHATAESRNGETVVVKRSWCRRSFAYFATCGRRQHAGASFGAAETFHQLGLTITSTVAWTVACQWTMTFGETPRMSKSARLFSPSVGCQRPTEFNNICPKRNVRCGQQVG